MDDLYRELILDHYKHPRNFGHLTKCDVSSEKDNPMCGDEISVNLAITRDRVTDIRFSGHGCAISIASASLLSEEVKGKKIKDLLSLTKDDIVNLIGTEILTPVRLKCAILPLEVIHKALIKYEKKTNT